MDGRTAIFYFAPFLSSSPIQTTYRTVRKASARIRVLAGTLGSFVDGDDDFAGRRHR